jgi:hypothetical protein
MHLLRLTWLAVFGAILVTGCGKESPLATAPAAPAESIVELKPAKFPQLVEAIKAQKGKVVVLDVWGEF